MSTLRRSTNRKTAAHLAVQNAFGLPAGVTCPGATATCLATCYAARTEYRPAVAKVMHHNLAALQAARTIPAMADLIRAMISEFHADCEYRGVAKMFRIHWDGDFFSRPYARAWARVIREYPDVQFWAYTRSFIPRCNVVPILAGIPNLALYLSVDADNRQHVKAAQMPGVRLAALADTMANGEPLIREFTPGRPGGMCPENLRRLPLINEAKQGACFTCGLCVEGKTDIRFATTKR